MPTCEICGRECNSTREIALEGAQLHACSRCSELGKPIHQRKNAQYDSDAQRIRRPIYIDREIRRGPPRPKQRELVPVEDFSKLIRQAREQRGMAQKDVARELNERTSVITKVESGKMAPTLNLARKLERLFKLTLLEEAESVDLSPVSSHGSTTLGDVVQIKRKKPSSQ